MNGASLKTTLLLLTYAAGAATSLALALLTFLYEIRNAAAAGGFGRPRAETAEELSAQLNPVRRCRTPRSLIQRTASSSRWSSK